MFIYALYKTSLWNTLNSKNKRIRVVVVAVIAYAIIYQLITYLIKDKELSSKLIKYLCYIVVADLVAALLFNYMGETTSNTSLDVSDEKKYIPSHLQHLQNTPKPEYIQPVSYAVPSSSASSSVSQGPSVQFEQQPTLGTTPDGATVPIPKLKAKQTEKSTQPKKIDNVSISSSNDSPYNLNSLLNADIDSSSGSDIIPIYHSKPDSKKDVNTYSGSSENNIPVYKSRK